MKVAVFPGSFDPITIGHVSLIKRAARLFDKVIIAIGVNTSKNKLFPLDVRIKWIRDVFEKNKKIEVQEFDGLTVDFCKKVGANFIIRGLRNASDFDYEKTIAQLNSELNKDIETVLFMTKPKHSHISSTIVREIIRVKGDASMLVPKQVDLNYKED
ncbi:MAG: pantetheine-phosphate adenylyltransferase [Saprospiraceae bacterium]|nr:pantetheine-phosphate adenylyltransferase [Saprospiraceae bacterium]